MNIRGEACLISYTKLNVLTITLIITIIIYSLLIITFSYGSKAFKKIQQIQNQIVTEEKYEKILENKSVTNPSEIIEKHNSSTNVEKIYKQDIWQIEIPAIELIATICEGTTSEVMNKYVGYFSETDVWNGNVGLAAHNRGYPVNYFASLKSLQVGDKIIYKTNYGERTYLVKIVTIIQNTNWSYLETTLDNRITLITCVENEPEYRRCIQGIEEESYEEDENSFTNDNNTSNNFT